MDFSHTRTVEDLRSRLTAFMQERVLPAEAVVAAELAPEVEQGAVLQWIADARTEVNAARLLVLSAAWRMDTEGAKQARHDISAAKIFVPQAVKRIIDDAIQVFGAKGLSQDTPLAMLYSQARFLQIADGPDEVHRRSLALAEARATPLLSL